MRKGTTILAVALLALAGCQKLNYSNTPEIKLGEVWSASFSAPTYEQKVHVSIEPENCSVSAYLVKESDAQAIEEALSANREPDPRKILAGKTFKRTDSRQDYNFDATVPAKTPYRLFINGGARSTKVKIKVVGQ